MPIEIIHLSKSFEERSIFSDLCCSFPDGKITCILGPSGCGKTTLLNLILGLLKPDNGSIEGLPQSRIAAVFQEDRLISHLSAISNVRIVLNRRFPKSEILRALEAVGLGEAARQPVRELSGGMRRRVALVRALLADSPLVIMDEPFKGLDVDSRAIAIDFTRNRLKGRTALIVTHDPAEAAMLNAEILDLKSRKPESL